MELTLYCYKEAFLSAKQIAVLTIPLQDAHSSHVKSIILSMLAFAFDYHNGITALMWFVKYNPTDLSEFKR